MISECPSRGDEAGWSSDGCFGIRERVRKEEKEEVRGR